MCKNVLTECIIFISYHVVPARSGDSAAAPGSGLQTVVNHHVVAMNQD